MKTEFPDEEQLPTKFPDLERLPEENFWKHLLLFWWNRPRIFVEDLYEKYVLGPKLDKETNEQMEKIKRFNELFETSNQNLKLLEENFHLKLKINELEKNRLEK